jgi:hypothetical protein
MSRRLVFEWDLQKWNLWEALPWPFKARLKAGKASPLGCPFTTQKLLLYYPYGILGYLDSGIRQLRIGKKGAHCLILQK